MEKKAKGLRAITDAKLNCLRNHSELLDRAFNELKEVTEWELKASYDNIKEIGRRMDLSRPNKKGLIYNERLIKGYYKTI
jgi:hypothetical protein